MGLFHKLHTEPGQDMITSVNDVADRILARADCQTAAVRQPPKQIVTIVRLAIIAPRSLDEKRKYCLATFQQTIASRNKAPLKEAL